MMSKLFIMLLALTACSSMSKVNEQYEVYVDQEYTHYENVILKADVYVPKKSGLKRAVIVVHGGGWSKRSREDMNDISKKLAENNFVVMNISYRLAPANVFPACIVDYLRAVQWLKANAKKYEVDAQRIGALGYSAGAHIVSLGALLQESSAQDQKIFGKENLKNTKIKAVVAGGTPSDLRKFTDSNLVVQFLGKKYDGNQDLYASASPVVYAHSKAPSFFLYHGQNDWIVDRNQMDFLETALKSKGVSVETHEVPIIGHVATFLWSGESVDRAISYLNKKL